jgi:hypothetical protein
MSAEKPRPRLIEVGTSVSLGGKIQIKRYEVDSSYYFNTSGKWEIPEGYSEEEAESFRYEQMLRLKQELEAMAQTEVDALLAQKAALS